MEALIFLVIIAIIVIAFLHAGIKIVPQGQQWTVERFGRYTKTLRPGLSLLIPFFDRVSNKLSMMETVVDVPSQTVISKDNVSVTSDGVVFFRVDDARLAAYAIDDLQKAIVSLVTTNLRSTLGAMELDEMLSNRESINTKLLAAVDEATAPWGVKITRIEISDLSMSKEIQEAMNMQMTAERRRRAQVTEATGKKEALVLEATGNKEAEILDAEAEKQAEITRAQGVREAAEQLAEARKTEARAEAEATKVISEAIKAGDVSAINYFVALKYVEALKEIGGSENSKLVMMPLEASGVTGAIAGVTELINSVKPGGLR